MTTTAPAAESPAATGDAVLLASGLTRSFGDRVAVDDVGFHIAPGETYGLLGPNGAGKTTTIRLICGLLRRDSGTVSIDGHDVEHDAKAAKALVGYVPQEVALYPDLTAAENLRFFGRLYPMSRHQLAERVDAVLELTDLTDRAGDIVDTFSGGMKRRLNIGVGLLHQPRLLILDEPTVGVDPQSRHAILESVDRFGGEGMAVLYTTHYMEEAEQLCDRVGIIDQGKLIAEGTTRELVSIVAEQDQVRLAVSGDLGAVAAACEGLDEVDTAKVVEGEVRLLLDDAAAALPAILGQATALGASVKTVHVVEPDLEAVFLHLTGSALRE
jgi:ABC-2 type transport system ATP-binding protein